MEYIYLYRFFILENVSGCSNITGSVIVYSTSNTVLLNSTLTFTGSATVNYSSGGAATKCLLRGKYGTSSTIDYIFLQEYTPGYIRLYLKQSPSGIEIWAGTRSTGSSTMSGSYSYNFSSNPFSIHYA